MRHSFLFTLLLAACGPGINPVSTESTASPMSIPAPECAGHMVFEYATTGNPRSTVCGAQLSALTVDIANEMNCPVEIIEMPFNVTTHGGFTREAVVSGTLYDDWGNVIHAPVAPNSNALLFDGNIMDFDPGESRQARLELNLAPCPEDSTPFSVQSTFMVRDVVAEFLTNGNAVPQGALRPNAPIVGDTFMFVASEATVIASDERPEPNTFAPGSSMAYLDAFEVTATSEPLDISTWSLVVEGASAFSSITVEYYGSDGSMNTQTAYVVDNTATFTASNLFMPTEGSDVTAYLIVYGDLNLSVTPGTIISASWTSDDLRAVGTDSGWTYGPSDVTPFVQGVRHTVGETSTR